MAILNMPRTTNRNHATAPEYSWHFIQILKKLHTAADRDDLLMVKQIVAELKETSQGKQHLEAGRASLFSTIRNKQVAVLEYLLSEGAIPEMCDAEMALSMNDRAILKLLVKYGWDINEQEAWHTPPLLA